MIKTESALLDDFREGQFLGITSAKLRDLIDSIKSVGGIMLGEGEQVVTSSWLPFTALTLSKDTKGLQENLAIGTYTVGAGADGLYAIDINISMIFPATGRARIAIIRNGALTDYRAVEDFHTDVLGHFRIAGGLALEEGDEFGIAIKGAGTVTGSVINSQFRAIRI